MRAIASRATDQGDACYAGGGSSGAPTSPSRAMSMAQVSQTEVEVRLSAVAPMIHSVTPVAQPEAQTRLISGAEASSHEISDENDLSSAFIRPVAAQEDLHAVNPPSANRGVSAAAAAQSLLRADSAVSAVSMTTIQNTQRANSAFSDVSITTIQNAQTAVTPATGTTAADGEAQPFQRADSVASAGGSVAENVQRTNSAASAASAAMLTPPSQMEGPSRPRVHHAVVGATTSLSLTLLGKM